MLVCLKLTEKEGVAHELDQGIPRVRRQGQRSRYGRRSGATDFNKLQIVLKNAVLEPVTNKVLTPEVAIRYGAFINTMLDFLIVAFCLFMVIKIMNTAR